MDPFRLEALYVEHFDELAGIATSQYAIPPDEAEELANDAFISGLCHLGKVADPHQWLVATVRYAARHCGAKIEDRGRDDE